MLGMEMMISNMLGMKPEEIQKAVKETISALENAAANMAAIHKRLTAIENHLGMNGENSNGRRKLPKPNSEHIQL